MVLPPEPRFGIDQRVAVPQQRQGTNEILELRCLAVRIGRRECPDRDPTPFLDWIERVALLVDPSPLGKRRSRDAKDDPFLACALASRAEFIVTKDKDLLALDKPFGVKILTPRAFYRTRGALSWAAFS